ncbi:hypothetical protein [Priestia megaterium]|uniref:hypothetical protein n=1 Tax=Priestia megaterium TaxID=1404 RepID=UPI00209D737C|nr:hypothetical protein [Priestia megaterium]MCP1450343.1 hypothetical protein [Priestia megaterium]
MRNNPKNFSVKIIKGHAYVYSWSYRKRSYRNHSISQQRYYWKYRGRYGTRKVSEFIKRLNPEKQNELKEMVQKKLELHKAIQKKIQDLLEIEPYKTRYNKIIKITNRIMRDNELRKLYSDLTSIIKNNEME